MKTQVELLGDRGVMTSPICGPVAVPPSQWIKAAWGDYAPEWHDERKAEKVMSLMIRLSNSIADLLTHEPENFDPCSKRTSMTVKLSPSSTTGVSVTCGASNCPRSAGSWTPRK